MFFYRLHWLDILKMPNFTAKTPKQIAELKICAEHFKDTDFTNKRKDHLVYNAVPLIISKDILYRLMTQRISSA